MSKIKVDQLEGSTGSTITVPTGQTLTITDGLAASTITSGTIASARLGSGTADATTFLRGDGTFATAGGGKVLQYVSNFDNTEVATNVSTTPNFAMGSRLDLAITPSATSSRILVMYNFGTISSGAAGNIGYGVIKVSNDGFSSNETIPVAQGSHQVTSNYSHFGINLNDQTYQTNQVL